MPPELHPLAAIRADCDNLLHAGRKAVDPIRKYPLRKIAENELAGCFSDLDDAARDELATSLVRQWLANDGHAGLVTRTHQCWFQLVAKEDGVEVGCSKAEGNWGRVLSRDWQVDEKDVPGLLHRLNLCQTARCRTADGRTIRLRVEPKERKVRCEEQAGEDE
jgi:hypothetical protein